MPAPRVPRGGPRWRFGLIWLLWPAQVVYGEGFSSLPQFANDLGQAFYAGPLPLTEPFVGRDN